MSQNVNRIHNADFSRGRGTPARWTWNAGTGPARWERGLQGLTLDPADAADAGSSGITIVTEGRDATAHWSQIVVCKPKQFYRIEATVTCDLSAAHEALTEGEAGFVLSAQPMIDERPVGEAWVTPGVVRASKPLAVRTYCQVSEGVRRLRVAIGVVHAEGRVCIHHVRFIEILEPDAESHVMAIPPPPHTLPAPRVVRTVCVCSATASKRPLTHRLAAYFGAAPEPRASARALPGELQKAALKSDALILPDAQLPSSIRSIAGLIKLAGDRIVVVSLPALSRLAGDALSLRRIEQADDPIHAQVVHANYATRGFALHDTFPYAWAGRTSGSFVQNQFRKTGAMKAFCRKHGFVTLLVSMCDQDATSERPICLHKETPGGGLFVLDIEPAEAESSTFSETTLAMYLLLGILGQPQSGLGQYVSPVRTQPELTCLMRDMADRFEPFVVHDSGLPAEEVAEQIVTVGAEDRSFGLAIQPKPVILIRSGLTPGDAESVYGALLWFKQFVRMVPHTCPYAKMLASRFRLVWVPAVAPWCARDGWRRSPCGTGFPTGRPVGRARRGRSAAPDDLTLEILTNGGHSPPNHYAALIDIVSRPIHRTRVVLPSEDGAYGRYAEWLPQLEAAFPAGRHLTFGVPDREGFGDGDSRAWRRAESRVEVVVDHKAAGRSGAFGDGVHREVMAAGGALVRIEIPGNDADFAAQSIQRTDVAATLLEHVIGLQFGLIGVNRQSGRVKLAAFPPIGPGEALMIDRNDPMLRIGASRTG